MPRQHDRSLFAAVGTRIRELRAAKGLTQEKLAEGAMIEPRTLSGIENGRQGASLTVLAAIAAELGQPLTALVDFASPLPTLAVPSRDEWDELWERMSERERGVVLRVAREILAL